MRFVAIIGLGAALLLGGVNAHAASLHYQFERITGNASESLSRQLGMQVESSSGGALFTFRNDLGIASSVTDIYFDDHRSGLFRTIAYSADSGVGVSFDSQATPANLPGGKAVGFSASFSGDSNNRSVEQGVVTAGVPANGLNRNGEWVSFLGFWAGAANFEGLLAAIDRGDFRVGLHVQAIGLSGASDSYMNQPSAVPLPAAAWLFASALFGFVVISNRRKL